jgi:HD superfamily phosphodiesterase
MTEAPGGDELADLAEELERTADRLRAGDLDPEAAAEHVERCAELAARLGAELDRRARSEGTSPGQESLL